MENESVQESPEMVPVREFVWTDDYSYMRWLTCRNHPTARYLTKNPFWRSLLVLRFDETLNAECPCPFDDLMVIVERSKPPTD